MPSRFNAPGWAFVLVVAAFVPRFFDVSLWPPEGVLLFLAFVLAVIGLVQQRFFGSVLVILILIVVGPGRTFIVPFMRAATTGHKQLQQTTAAQLAGGEDAASTPTAGGVNDPASSQRAAIRKYPDLAVKDSALNRAFLARYAAWKQQGDPRLQQPNWPELLADDCAQHP